MNAALAYGALIGWVLAAIGWSGFFAMDKHAKRAYDGWQDAINEAIANNDGWKRSNDLMAEMIEAEAARNGGTP